MALRNRGYGYILIYLYLADDARKFSRNPPDFPTTNGSHRETRQTFRRRTEVTAKLARLSDDGRKSPRNPLNFPTTDGGFRETRQTFRRRTEVSVPILHDFHPLPFRMMKVYSSAAPYSQTKMSKKNSCRLLTACLTPPVPTSAVEKHTVRFLFPIICRTFVSRNDNR